MCHREPWTSPPSPRSSSSSPSSIVSDSLRPHGQYPARIHGISYARVLEWVAISFSRGSSQPRDRIHISFVSCFGRRILYPLSHLGGPWMTYLDSIVPGPCSVFQRTPYQRDCCGFVFLFFKEMEIINKKCSYKNLNRINKPQFSMENLALKSWNKKYSE